MLTMPPIRASGLGSGGKNSPSPSNDLLRSIQLSPGCTIASISALFTDNTLSMRLKSMQAPPLVESNEPGKLVPPEYALTGILLLEQMRIMSLTSCVLLGKSTSAGLCSFVAKGSIQALRDLDKQSWTSSNTKERPRIPANSAFASEILESDTSWAIGGVSSNAVTELEETIAIVQKRLIMLRSNTGWNTIPRTNRMTERRHSKQRHVSIEATEVLPHTPHS